MIKLEIKIKVGPIEGYYKTDKRGPFIIGSCTHLVTEKKINGESWLITMHGQSDGKVDITQKRLGGKDDY